MLLDNAEAATAMAEHRILFLQLMRTVIFRIDADPSRFGDLADVFIRMQQSVMQRRIEQTDRYRLISFAQW